MTDHDDQAVENVAADDVPVFDAADPTETWDVSTFDRPGQTLLEFTGPALTFTVPAGTTVESLTDPDGREVSFVQDGSVLARPNAHFGRGRWTVQTR